MKQANNYFTVTTVHDVLGVVRDYVPFNDTTEDGRMVAASIVNVEASREGRKLMAVAVWRVKPPVLAALWDVMPGVRCPRIGEDA